MDYTLNGASGFPNWVDTSYDQPVYAGMPTYDVATTRQDVQDVGSNDAWGDWFKTMASNVVSYSLAKDAAVTKTQASQPQYMQPAAQYSQGASVSRQGVAVSSSTLLLVGGVVAVMLFLQKQ
jgi:hypothetical protein